MSVSVYANIASVLLFNERDEALFQHRDNIPSIVRPNMWVPPGGHCEEGETREQSALREFFEETGYRCPHLRFVGSWDDLIQDRLYRVHLFWDTYDGVSPLHCYEGQELRFIARNDAQRYDIPPNIIELWDYTIQVRETYTS